MFIRCPWRCVHQHCRMGQSQTERMMHETWKHVKTESQNITMIISILYWYDSLIDTGTNPFNKLKIAYRFSWAPSTPLLHLDHPAGSR
uniref:Uncharacterized protein n=1 Tax=Mola mola TaxID=94237 RepID=A0A3Q3X6Y4_MOLML